MRGELVTELEFLEPPKPGEADSETRAARAGPVYLTFFLSSRTDRTAGGSARLPHGRPSYYGFARCQDFLGGAGLHSIPETFEGNKRLWIIRRWIAYVFF